ncbi:MULTISPECIES: GGDEF domain-containing protein [unclassified Iodobacter]|uniref:GGDEF domain-containing protein n=1 Tax=unclassified Iodobacter TaxID=235634 RepID=UPI0025D88910|nr:MULTISPECIES: GGDEF domain-containing protein [unclassified Iodobacter]MDW5416097.1 GGDEF domain-containing protein [Iodobacter sp. CM08]
MKQALTFLNPERYFIAFILFIGYVGIGFINIQQAHLSPGHLAVIWLPAGIGLLMALEIGPAAFIFIFFASFILNTPTYYYINTPSNTHPLITSLLVGIGTALIDVWQAYMAAKAWQFFLTKHHRSPLQKPTDLPYFWGKICFIPALFSMALTHTLLSLSSIISTQDGFSNIQQMFMLIMGDTAGLFIVAPIYASWKSSAFKYRIRPAIPYFFALILIIALGFLLYSYLMMLILPILLLIAIRFRLAGTSLALLIVFMLSMIGTTHHIGPFFTPSEPLSFLNLQLFLFSIGLTLHYLALLQELLSHSHLQLETEVTLRTEALAAANQRLEELVTTDELTGVANRREWQRRCEEAIIYARRYQQPLSILLIDIDHFKNVNDQHGHLAGDLTLKELCRVCTAELRATDSFARWGGEEFVLLLPGTTQVEAILAGNKLRIAVENQALVEYHEQKIRITISVGVAMLEDNDSSLDHLLNRADQAMYAAKAAGRNQVQCAISSTAFNH